MAQFNLDNYETVASRLDRWLTSYEGDNSVPRTRVETDLVHYSDNRCVFKASIYVDNVLVATGWAEETRGEGMVNKTSHVENCESSAVGRALANAGLAGADPAKRPSREEMTKVQRNSAPAQNVNQVVDMLKESFGEGSEIIERPTPQIKDPNAAASSKQIGMIRMLLKQKGLETEDQKFYVEATIGRRVEKLDEITKGEASQIIGELQK
jgi:hypothetical protein